MPISLFVSMLAALRRESSSGTSAAAGANGDGSKKKVLASNVDKEIKGSSGKTLASKAGALHPREGETVPAGILSH